MHNQFSSAKIAWHFRLPYAMLRNDTNTIILLFSTKIFNLVNRTNLVTNFLNIFIAFLYMFRATICPSSGENTVPKRHPVLVTLYRWLSGMQGGIPPCIPDSHLYRVTNTECRIGMAFFSDDRNIVARNMHRKAINILRKFVHNLVLFTRLYKYAPSTKYKNLKFMILPIITSHTSN